MHNQIRIEANKLKKSVFFYLTILAFFALGLMFSLKMVVVDKEVKSGAYIFLSSISDTSLMFILTMFASYFIGNEFTNRTVNNEIRVGYSRLSIIISRAIVVLPFAFAPYIAYIIASTLVMGFANGLGVGLPVQDLVIRFLLFAMQVMAIQSITLFIMFVCKKASLGMMISISLSVITCNLLRNLLKDGGILFKYTSFYRIMMNNQNMSTQDVLVSFTSAIATILLMTFISYIAFRNAELK